MSVKISVIIPCYNVEKYIDRCIQSLVKQTIGLEDMELIFINDGSSDHTYAHLLEWKKFSNNIIVVDCKKNGGSGRARNIGMQQAKGAFLGFVDADDWVEPDMYEKLYEAITSNQCDVAQCLLVRDKEERYNSRQKGKAVRRNSLIEISDSEKRNELIARGIISGYPVNKLYKRELLMENEVYFPEKTAYEDVFFLGLLTMYVNKIYILREELYHYFYNDVSQSSLKNSTHHRQLLEVCCARLTEYSRRGLSDKYRKGIIVDFLRRYYLNGVVTMATKMPEFTLGDFQNMRNTIVTNIGEEYKNENVLQYFNNDERNMISLLERDIEENIWRDILKRLRKKVKGNCVIVIDNKEHFYHEKTAILLCGILEEWEYDGIIIDISSGKEDCEYYEEIINKFPHLIITLDMAGFHFRTELDSPAYNTMSSRMLNIIFSPLKDYEMYLKDNLNFSMFFYTGDKKGMEYLLEKYPDIPNLVYSEDMSMLEQGTIKYYTYETAGDILHRHMEEIELPLMQTGNFE
jgi:glycosyltransferase involved in cell wall biosynthesis